MKLSEELIWRGFSAKTTIKNPEDLDNRENKQFYWGADPSADSLTIGNLAALMMCACFVRHGYKPYLLVGGATGQIGDPKENGERDLKTLDEVEHNKSCIKQQVEGLMERAGAKLSSEGPKTRPSGPERSKEERLSDSSVTLLDNLDWFKDMNYLSFLREIGKTFSMTQLLDRQFVQNRIGEGGSGISYAEFSYTLIQGYDFLHLYRKYGISLQLCGADQYGNCASGIHLIRRLENAEADIWSTPLIIDPVTGRKFGKSEGNAVWLASTDNGSGNFTTIFDFYQFWLNQPDSSVEYLLKIYTLYDKESIEDILRRHTLNPSNRIAQKALAKGVTEVVHGKEAAEVISRMTEQLFNKNATYTKLDLEDFAKYLPTAKKGANVIDSLVETGLCASKTEARKLITQGAISFIAYSTSSEAIKISSSETKIEAKGILKKGKNNFAIIL